MLKQKIDTAALFAQKKTEVQSSARTLLILDGQENAYISADELTEELLAIPEEGAIWLDMSLFGSHDQVMTVARSFKLSPATQNILENKKQQPRLFRDGNNRILICRHLQLNESGNAVYNNICFAASANRLLSLQHGRCDRLKNARTLVTTLQKPNNTIPQALTLILGKILDDNCEVINYLEERLQLLSAAYSEQDEHPDPKELLRLRRSLVTAKQAVYPMRRIVSRPCWAFARMPRSCSRALRQDPPLVIGSDNAPELLTIKLEGAVLTLSVAEELLTSLERLCVNAAAERSADIQATLTTVAVIFLPLICISSIFAMNFQYMPELKSQWGYPLCLGVMALIAIFTLKKLQRKKWY